MKKVNMNKAPLPSMSSRAAASMMQSAMVIIASKTAKNLSERSSFSPFGALSCINRPFCTIYKRYMMDFLCSHYKILLDPSPITTLQGQDDACSDTVRNDISNPIPQSTRKGASSYLTPKTYNLTPTQTSLLLFCGCARLHLPSFSMCSIFRSREFEIVVVLFSRTV